MVIVKNKKLFIILGTILSIIIICIVIFMILLSPVSKDSKEIEFTINKGDSKTKIVENLKDASLVRSKYASLIYIVLSGNTNLQAGSYELSRNMSTKEVIKALNNGDIKNTKKEEVRVTFKEGDTLKNFITSIPGSTNIDYDEAISTLSNKEYLQKLIDKYWFLTSDILDEDIYYPLEGYLYPETYNFYKETTIEEVVTKVLDITSKKLESLKDEISKSKYSVHEILTVASIVEKEAVNATDRSMVSQVIYKRLDLNMSLGMDVTSYYGVQKDMKETITSVDLNDKNPYNTRVTTFIGLPIGPICNPSLESIIAALKPADTDYLYFVADVTTSKVYFAKDSNEFNVLVKKYVK